MNLKILSFADSIAGALCLLVSGLFQTRKRSCPENVDNIVIIKFLGYGSLILAAPVIFAIKKHYPGAKLILYTTKNLQPHAGMLKLFDETAVLIPEKPLHSIFTLFKLRRRLSSGRTLVINLEFLSKTAIFLAGFLRGSYCLSLTEKEYSLLDRAVLPDQQSTTAAMYDKLLTVFKIKNDTGEYAEYLNSHYNVQPLKQIIIAPFCSNLSLRRLWNNEKWSLLISHIRTVFPDYSISIIGAPSDRKSAQKIIENSKVNCGIHNYCGEISFEQTAILMKQSSCFCGIDSAPLHLARLTALPSVSLWGATDPFLLTREIPDYPEIIIFARQKCTPCVHSKRKCPFPEGCLNLIDTKIVMSAVSDLITGKIKARKSIIC